MGSCLNHAWLSQESYRLFCFHLLQASLHAAGSIEDLVGQLEVHDQQQAEARTALKEHHEALEIQAAIASQALEQQLLR